MWCLPDPSSESPFCAACQAQLDAKHASALAVVAKISSKEAVIVEKMRLRTLDLHSNAELIAASTEGAPRTRADDEPLVSVLRDAAAFEKIEGLKQTLAHHDALVATARAASEEFEAMYQLLHRTRDTKSTAVTRAYLEAHKSKTKLLKVETARDAVAEQLNHQAHLSKIAKTDTAKKLHAAPDKPDRLKQLQSAVQGRETKMADLTHELKSLDEQKMTYADDIDTQGCRSGTA